MKGKKLLALLLMCVAVLAVAFSASAAPVGDFEGFDGMWYEPSEDAYYFFEDGVYVTDQWEEWYDETYYFGADGKAYGDGIYTISGKDYGFQTYGELYKDAVFYFAEWNEATESSENVFYCADENGVIIKGKWAQPAYSHYYCENLDGIWFYLGADGVAYRGIQKVGSKYYFFDEDDASLYYEGSFGLWDEEDEEYYYYYATGTAQDGALAQNMWVTDQDGDKTYYGNDCKRVDSKTAWIGDKLYAFDYDGKMLCNIFTDLYDYEADEWNYYYIGEDGVVATNKWVLIDDGYGTEYWYYFGADGKAYRDGAYKINNKYYYFYSDGAMAADTEIVADYWDDTLEEWVFVGAYRASAGGALLTNTWYESEDGDYFYYGADGKGVVGIQTIGGKKYCFNEYGYWLKDTAATVKVNGVYKHFVVMSDGTPYEAQNNTWTKINGHWYYVQNGGFCESGFYTIGGKKYAFDWNAQMRADEFFYTDYYEGEEYIGWFGFYAKPNGILAQNEVIVTEHGVYLFNEYGYAPDMYGLYNFNGDYYYLNGTYNSVTYNQLCETEEGVYAFGADGKGTKINNGWYHNTFSEYSSDWYWLYVRDDALLCDGVYQIGEKKYAFDSDGWLLTDSIYYDDVREGYVLLTPMNEKGQGGHVCEEVSVWKKVNGAHVYLNAEGLLHTGWLANKYYMTPYMTYCDFTADEDYVYMFNINGQKQAVTTTGFFDYDGMRYYLESGKIQRNVWKKVNNGWYYFNNIGIMLTNTPAEIKGVQYFFDHNGRMCDSGWFRDVYGDWYWAAKSGALFIGKDSAGYLFDTYGRLVINEVYCMEDTWYVTNTSGKIVGSFNTVGWNEVNGKWYLVLSYYDEDEGTWYDIASGGFYAADGRFFAFDSQTNQMLHDRFYDDNRYYLGGNGAAKQGWFQLDGCWYYGDPEDYGYLYHDGIYQINDKEYAFDSFGKLIQNKTFYSWGYDAIITTDINGVVIKQTNANGWQYDNEGDAYYYKDGTIYTGWIGNYYIEYSRMVIDEIIYDDNKEAYYYINKKGVKLTSGWYERWDDEWICARADGRLYQDEWFKSNNKWYYFDDIWMAYAGVYTIDGVEQVFDANGVWLGRLSDITGDYSNKPDGWLKQNNKWYFVMAGELVTDEALYINGNWYYFDYDGCMVTDMFRYDYSSFNEYVRYYTASGAAATYKGWQRIHNKWVFFNNDSTVSLGWITANGKTYYQDYTFADDAYSYEFGEVSIVTGYRVIDDVLCQFNSDGALMKTITAKGWYKGDGAWYYIDGNGQAVNGEEMYKIGNAYYAFDGDGKMIANRVYGEYYYGANGAAVTKAGWYQVGKQWVYVLKDGRAARYGVFRINGKDQYFYDGYWLG